MENPIEERNRAETRQTVEMITESRKRKRINIANKNKMNYARMLANFRTNKMKRTVRVNMIADKVGKKKEQEAPVNTNKKSFTIGLHYILDADLLGELTTEDSQLGQLRKHILAKDREGFLRLGSYMANFWDDASVINDCIIIDNRVAIPTCLRKAVMARLHRTHPGQEAMVDAAQYLWWPKMHREIIDLCQTCRSCSAYGKNLKTSKTFNSAEPLPELSEVNEELQIDLASPMFDSKGKKLFIIVAIDRFSKYPSAMITRKSGSEKILKFLKNYIHQNSIPKNLRTYQYSGFKNAKLAEFCKSKGINQIFCPVGDHRGCGLVERCIQTIKRKLGTMQLDPNFEDIQTAVKSILEDIRISRHSILKKSLFELHFGRKPNTEWSNFRDKLKCSLNLDQQRLERSLLKPEEMRESADSRTRLKVVKKGMASRDVSPKMKRNGEGLESIRALENLANAASDWKLHRKHLSHKEGSEALRKLTERNPLLAVSLRSDLNHGTLRFRVEPEVPEHRTKTSNLEFDLIHYPEKEVVYRKILDRKSGRPLFERLNGKIVEVTNNTYITENGKVIRKNPLSLKPKFKSAYCSGLGKKTPAASMTRKPLHQCSSSGSNRPSYPAETRRLTGFNVNRKFRHGRYDT